MAGYLPDSATAESVIDGWYRTGDVGYLESEGWVHLTDRLKEMIKVNGFQVAPAEIEAVLLGHPGVLDCAVFGIADEWSGEVPVAAVHLDPAASVGEEELKQLVADTLATYKQLRHVIVVDAVPRLPSGKASAPVTPRAVGACAARCAGGGVMDVRLSPEQHALRDAAAQVVDRLGPGTVAGLDDTERSGRLADAVAASGWLELRQRGEDDGPLASGVEVAIVAEELGRGLADVPFLGPVMASDLCRRAGAEPADAPGTVLLDRTLSWPACSLNGETPAGVSVDAAPGQAALALLGDGTGAGWRLGRVPLLAGGSQLDLTRRSSAADDGAALVVLETPEALGEDHLAAWTALGLALTCADLVGVMRGAFELARSYASSRRQYEAPIGSFQALQHLLVDAYVAVEGSRSVALHAAWAVDALAAPDALAAAAAAKAYCARAALCVCETSVQVHGGIGNTWDCLAHVFLRRALLSIELFGGAETNVGRVLAHHGIRTPVGSSHGLR